jgi:hypothetical protein
VDRSGNAVVDPEFLVEMREMRADGRIRALQRHGDFVVTIPFDDEP